MAPTILRHIPMLVTCELSCAAGSVAWYHQHVITYQPRKYVRFRSNHTFALVWSFFPIITNIWLLYVEMDISNIQGTYSTDICIDWIRMFDYNSENYFLKNIYRTMGKIFTWYRFFAQLNRKLLGVKMVINWDHIDTTHSCGCAHVCSPEDHLTAMAWNQCRVDVSRELFGSQKIAAPWFNFFFDRFETETGEVPDEVFVMKERIKLIEIGVDPPPPQCGKNPQFFFFWRVPSVWELLIISAQ